MILTTESQGLPEGPTHLAQMARNAQRIADWRERLQTRSDNTPTGSNAADFAARPDSWAALLAWALGLGIGLWLLAWLWIAWEIRQVPEPETRCFENHVSGETVCREQKAWSVEP